MLDKLIFIAHSLLTPQYPNKGIYNYFYTHVNNLEIKITEKVLIFSEVFEDV